MLCSERHSSETFSHKMHPHTSWPLGDCTYVPAARFCFDSRTSQFTLHTPTHTSCSPELVALPPENNNCRPSESRSGLIHVMWPSTNASLWRQQFSFSVGQKCFGGHAAIVSRGRKSCIPVCGAGGSLDAESVKFIPITSQLLVRARERSTS
jgi:hypothetical protein